MQKLEPFSITLTRVKNSIKIEVPLHKICFVYGSADEINGSFVYISEQADPVHVKETIQEIKKLWEPTLFINGEKLC